MKWHRIHVLSLIFTASFLFVLCGASQEESSKPRPQLSPKAAVMETINTTEVEIVYHRPGVKGRVIFGDLVPYGEPWRAGANEATTFAFSTDVMVGDKRLPAGKYGFWMIPRESGDWTIIFSNASDVWGTPYPEGQDALRVTLPFQTEDNSKERLEYFFEETGPRSSKVRFLWDRIEVHIPLSIPDDVARGEEPQLSPKARIMQTFETTDVTVTYHRPGVKGRTIFGDLVPYGEPWRAGANEATTIEFSADVEVEGKPLPAGKYGFWIIPRESGDWTLIFSNAGDVWGIPYPEGKDALRVSVTPEITESSHERLEYYFDGLEDSAVTLYLSWDTVVVPVRFHAHAN